MVSVSSRDPMFTHTPIEALRVGVSSDPEAHYGPVVNAAHKQRVENWIQTGVDEGAELVVDGRGFTLQGHEQGFFIGPSLFDMADGYVEVPLIVVHELAVPAHPARRDV